MKIAFIITASVTLISAILMGSIAENFYFSDGHHFSILDIEMADSKDDLALMFSAMNSDVLESVRLHLHVDYVFMVGCYPFVALVCFAQARYSSGLWKKVFTALAYAQVLPFAFDIIENISLEQWLDCTGCGLNFFVFRFMVIAKFSIALGAYLVCSLLLLYRSL
ncbi:MAG TPA: hypothetical protein VGK59_16605 [Ohtaekwangia sp.]